MATSIKLPDELVAEARRHGQVNSRSAPKQIEYWSCIGRIAEANPDMPYGFVRDILLARTEASEPFVFDEE